MSLSHSTSSSNHYCALLKLFCQNRNLTNAKKLHCHIIKSIPYPETFLLNNFISSYANLGSITYARRVFDQLPHPNLYSWNSILSAYSKLGRVHEMEYMFDAMPTRDGVSWNSLISGYAASGSIYQSVKAYILMLNGGSFNLNRVTFSTLLILASKRGCVQLGRQIHGHVLKFGFMSYVFVGSPLVDMYSKMGMISCARQAFDELPEKNVVMYNTLITGLMRCGRLEDSRLLFLDMRERDSISWTSMITGFTQNGLDRDAINFFREMTLENLQMDQ
jgi:pentatricopeptide repeat protein